MVDLVLQSYIPRFPNPDPKQLQFSITQLDTLTSTLSTDLSSRQSNIGLGD